MNAMIGLWARSTEVVYSVRSSSSKLDGAGADFAPGPALRPAKPSGTSRAPRTATDSGRTASRRSSPPQSPGPAARRPGLSPSAGHRIRKGALASPLRLQASRPRRRTCCPCDTREGIGARAYSMTRLVGCALSLSVFSLWQSPHSACKVCTLPAKACLTGTTWSSS